MKFLEKNLEDIIYESDNERLNQRGLPIKGAKLRQVKLGGYGVADLITIEREPVCSNNKYYGHNIHITIYELKQIEIGYSALGQCCRYQQAITEIIEKYKPIGYKIYNYTIDMVLIGYQITKGNDFCYVANNDHFLRVYLYDYGLDGITFELSTGWHKPLALYDLITKLNKEPF